MIKNSFECHINNYKEKSKRFSYYEYKYLIRHEHLTQIKHILDNTCGGIDPYPSGVVDSIYYDTLNENLFEQCLNGEYYKCKFRIRGYGDGFYGQAQLKIKKMSSVTKYKAAIDKVTGEQNKFPFWESLTPSEQHSTGFEMINYIGQRYGSLTPSIRVKYFRYRYRLYDYRITLDTNIEVFLPTNGLPGKLNYASLPYHVLELKTLETRPNLPFVGLIKLHQISCSKFMLGNMMLNNNSIVQ